MSGDAAPLGVPSILSCQWSCMDDVSQECCPQRALTGRTIHASNETSPESIFLSIITLAVDEELVYVERKFKSRCSHVMHYNISDVA